MLAKALLTLLPSLLALSAGAHAYSTYDADPSLDLYDLVARDLGLGDYLDYDDAPLVARAALPKGPGKKGPSKKFAMKSGKPHGRKQRRPAHRSSQQGQQGSGGAVAGGDDGEEVNSGGGSSVGSNSGGSSVGSN